MKPEIYSFKNSVEPDELASKTADQVPINIVFCTIKYMSSYFLTNYLKHGTGLFVKKTITYQFIKNRIICIT